MIPSIQQNGHLTIPSKLCKVTGFKPSLSKQDLFPALLSVGSRARGASRLLGQDLVWLPRAVEADCNVGKCWPKAGDQPVIFLLKMCGGRHQPTLKATAGPPLGATSTASFASRPPQVPSLANGGSVHWPWSMEETMLTCTAEDCTGGSSSLKTASTSNPLSGGSSNETCLLQVTVR